MLNRFRLHLCGNRTRGSLGPAAAATHEFERQEDSGGDEEGPKEQRKTTVSPSPAHSPSNPPPNRRWTERDSPLKGAKDDGRLDLPAVTPDERAGLVVVEAIADVDALGLLVEDGEGDEAGEPEEHGQGVEGEHGDGVGKGGEEARRQGQVDEDQEGPDRGEDHEAVFRGGQAEGCDWRVVLLAGVM